VLDLQDAAAGWGRSLEQYGPDHPETLSAADILTVAREALLAALAAHGHLAGMQYGHWRLGKGRS
jgi:hypothetical protein